MDLKRLEYLNKICQQLDSSVPVAKNISRYLREICYGSRLSKDEFDKVDMCPSCLTPCSAGRFSLRLQFHKVKKNRKKSSRLLGKQPTTLNNFQKFLLNRIKSKGDNVMRLTCLECQKVSKEYFKKKVLESPVLIEENLPKDDLTVVDETPKSKKKKKRKKDLLCGLKSSAVAEVRQNKAHMLKRNSLIFPKKYDTNPSSIITPPILNQNEGSAIAVNCSGKQNFVTEKTIKDHISTSKASSKILKVIDKFEAETVVFKKSENIKVIQKNDEDECGAINCIESKLNDSVVTNNIEIECSAEKLQNLPENYEIIPDERHHVIQKDLTYKKLNETVNKNNYTFCNRINNSQSLLRSENSVQSNSFISSNNCNVKIKSQTFSKKLLQTNCQSFDKQNVKSNNKNNIKSGSKANPKLSSDSGNKLHLLNKGNKKSKNKKNKNSRVSIGNSYKVFEKSNCRNSLCVKDLLNVT